LSFKTCKWPEITVKKRVSPFQETLFHLFFGNNKLLLRNFIQQAQFRSSESFLVFSDLFQHSPLEFFL